VYSVRQELSFLAPRVPLSILHVTTEPSYIKWDTWSQIFNDLCQPIVAYIKIKTLTNHLVHCDDCMYHLILH
jgi:hypothetical protein